MAKFLGYSLFFVRYVIACISALGVTLGVAIVIIMHDPIITDFMEVAICRQVSNAFACNFNAHVSYVDLIRGVVFLTDVVVVPTHTCDWFWTSGSIAVAVDWKKLLVHKQVMLALSCADMRVNTKVIDGTIAIAEHIQALMCEKKTTIPIIPEMVRIAHAHITVYLNEKDIVECNVSGAIDTIDHYQHIGLTIVQDKVIYRNQWLARDIQLSLKKVIDVHTKQETTELTGTLGVRDVVHDCWCHGKIEAELDAREPVIKFVSDSAGTEVSFTQKLVPSRHYQLLVRSAWGTMALETDLMGRIAIILPDTRLDLAYLLYPDHIDLKCTDVHERVLAAQIFYDGHYTVDGVTDFFYELLHKDSVPEVCRQFVLYADLLHLKTPFTILGERVEPYWQNTLELSKLQLRIPYTYNFLRSAQTTVLYAPLARYLLLRDVVLQTDRGRLISGISTIGFDEHYTINHIHAPIVVQDFFINQAKDFFAQISGAAVVEYRKDDRSKVTGTCTIKKCHVRNNPFSGSVGNDIVAATINPLEGHVLAQSTDLDLQLCSYEPVEIKTPVLQARAHVNLHLLGTVAQPQVYGQIELLQGSLNFPYKALEIQQGRIFFVDNQRDDPAIELLAHALVKNYSITLHVDGTAQSPNITFQSTPHLQEEQIIGLLIGGSPDSSLSLVMPLSSMGMVEKLLVGNTDELVDMEGFKKWLGPFEHVKIVPRFSDQTSRGGLRAALAIEVNDYVSALIQQNFSLSEDVLIEVAYRPLDELILRGIRDERGDFGAEAEARITW